MSRTPTLIRRLVAGVATATLGLTGLAAAPAHAATPQDSAPIGSSFCANTLSNASGQYPKTPGSLIQCTSPTFLRPWYTRGNESQTADVTITNETPYTLSVPGGGAVSHAPGAIWGVEHFPHLTLAPHGRPGSAATFQYTVGVNGPVTNRTSVINGTNAINLGYGMVATASNGEKITVADTAYYPAIDSWPPGQPHIWGFTAGAAATSQHVGVPDTITVRNNGSNTEWFELCQGVHPVAAGMHKPGTSLVHSVVEAYPQATTFTAWVGAKPSGCSPAAGYSAGTSAYLESQAIHIDWTGQPAPIVPTDPAPALVANAVNPGPSISSVDPIYVTDTSGHAEWLEVCAGGRAVSAGFHAPGTSLVYGARSARAGTVTYSAYPGLGCPGTPVQVPVNWQAGAETAAPNQIFADAAVYTPTVGTDDPAYAINTSGAGEWMTLCSGLTPLASGYHPAGGYVEHAVSAATPGQYGYSAIIGRDTCRGLTSQLILDWQS